MEGLQHYLGTWRRYQTRVYLLFVPSLIAVGLLIMNSVFSLHVAGHRCQLPGWPGVSGAMQEEACQEGMWEDKQAQCSFVPLCNSSSHVINRTADVINRTADVILNHTTDVTPSTACQAWIYDTSEMESTIISQFDMVCDRKTYRAHLNMAMLFGVMVGALMSGFLCDWCGRKVGYYVSTTIMLVVGIASAFPPNIESLLLYRFLMGCLVSANYLALFVLLVELSGNEMRSRAASILTITWLMGVFLLTPVSLVTSNWQYIQVISAAPLVLCLGHWWLLPESPRWLLTKNRKEEALAVILKVGKVNRMPHKPTMDTLEKLQKEQTTEGSAREIFNNMLQMFRHPRLAAVTLIIFFNWFVVNMTYYGLALNVGSLGGSLRVNFTLSTLVELLGYTMSWVLMNRLGRKRSHCIFIITSGLALFATILTVTLAGEDMQWITTVLAMVGKCGVSASFTAVYLIAAEIFPTVIRNMGLSCSSASGRVGSAISPYIADIALHVGGQAGRAVPLSIFGGLALLAGLLSLLLPETLNRTLPDTVEDAVHFVRNSHEKRAGEDGPSTGEEEEKAHHSLLSTSTTSAL